MIFSKKPYLALFLIIALFSVLPANSANHKTAGFFKSEKASYSFSRTAETVTVFEEGKKVFEHKCSPSEQIVSTGFSSAMNSLYCFKNRFINNRVSLICVTPAGEETVLSDMDRMVYNPVFTGKTGRTVAFVDGTFALTVMDIDSNRVLHKVQFKKPVYNLTTKTVAGEEKVVFYRLKGLGDEEISFSANDIRNSNINLEFGKVINGLKKANAAPANLNFRRFLCVGDSITRGKIGTVVRIDLGYILKLQAIIEQDLYSDEISMVNYGKNGETTREMLSRFDHVVSVSGNAGFLLLHMGTNDMPVEGISPMQTFMNLKDMAIKAKGYGMIPVLSTLIPRKPKDSLTGDFRPFNLETNTLLKAFAAENKIPVADFWDIFINHPEYDTNPDIMSDHVHPGRDGYKLMAEEWIKRIPPVAVDSLVFDKSKPNNITLNWTANAEKDIDHYIVKYSRGGDELNRTATVKIPAASISFMNPAYLSPFSFRVKLTIEAIDKDGNSSPVSPVLDSDN